MTTSQTTESSPPTPEVVEWLRRNEADCPVCRYRLEGLTEPICPECGTALHLTVGPRRLRLVPWLIAIMGFAGAAGFDLISGGGLLVADVFRPSSYLMTLGEAALTYGVPSLAVLCLIGLWVVVRGRARWLRQPHRTQWLLAILLCVAIFVGHLLFATLAVTLM